MTTGRDLGSSDSERFVRFYGWICLVGAVLGIVASAYFFVTGPTEVGWTLTVLTFLLVPAYLLVRWTVGRGR